MKKLIYLGSLAMLVGSLFFVLNTQDDPVKLSCILPECGPVDHSENPLSSDNSLKLACILPECGSVDKKV